MMHDSTITRAMNRDEEGILDGIKTLVTRKTELEALLKQARGYLDCDDTWQYTRKLVAAIDALLGEDND